MTEPTDPDALIQRFFGEVAPKVSTPMDLFGDQVVEGKRNLPLTTGTGFRHRVAQLCVGGNAASMAVVSSSPSGFTPLEKCPTISPSDDTTYLLKFQRG